MLRWLRNWWAYKKAYRQALRELSSLTERERHDILVYKADIERLAREEAQRVINRRKS